MHEHLKNNNKVLGDQVNNLNKTHVSILSDLSKASKEKKTLEATLTNQEASIQTITTSLALVREKFQKKEEEIAALQKVCIDKFAVGANHMKTILFQDLQGGRHLSQEVEKFLAEQEDVQKLAAESDRSDSNDFEATTAKA